MSLFYRAEVTPDDGAFLITSPSFGELTTFSETDDPQAVGPIFVAALEEAIAARIADLEEIPVGEDALDVHTAGPNLFALPALTVFKVELYRALLASDLNRQQLAKQLGWHREQVDRLFRLDHKSQIDQIEAAATVLGYRLETGLRSLEMMEGGRMRTHTNNVDTTAESIDRTRAQVTAKRALDARLGRRA